MSSRRRAGGWWRHLPGAIAGGGALGLWLLLEPLLRCGTKIARQGQPLEAFLLPALAIGAALAAACWAGLAILGRLTGRRLLPTAALAWCAGILAGLMVYWALRESTPVIFGIRDMTLYSGVGIVAGLILASVGHTLHFWPGRPRWMRNLLAAPLWIGPLMALAAAVLHLSGQRSSEIARGEMPWAGGPVRRVFLITVDALRADHVGAYGYARPTTPVMDRLAAQGILYRNAYAQGNRSDLSVGSLLTGLIPSAHAVRRSSEGLQFNPLSPEVPTLAELFARAGFTTVGLLSNPYLKRDWGLDRGFQVADEFSFHYRRLLLFRLLEKLRLLQEPEVDILTIPRGPEITGRALHLLERHRDEPLFVLVHYMDAHHPYFPPDSLVARFESPGASAADPGELFVRIMTGRLDRPEGGGLPPADLRRLEDLYDGVGAYADAEIGRLLLGLRSMGLLEERA